MKKTIFLFLLLFLVNLNSCSPWEKEIIETHELNDCKIIDFHGGKHIYISFEDVYGNKYEKVHLGKYISCSSNSSEPNLIGKRINVIAYYVRWKEDGEVTWIEYEKEKIIEQICELI